MNVNGCLNVESIMECLMNVERVNGECLMNVEYNGECLMNVEYNGV